LEYKHIVNAHPELTDIQKEAFRQDLLSRLKNEMKEEMLDDVTKDVKKEFETRYEKEKVENIKTLTIVGILLSFLVGLAVNQCTEFLSLFKYLFPKYEHVLTIIFFLIFSCLILVILLRFIFKTISNTFSTK